MSKAIGIDLGTTNSCVAVVEAGRAVIIPNEQGERTTPSVVAFNAIGERLVGSAARRQSAVNAQRTISSVKRHMGTDWRARIGDKDYTPQEISAMILRRLKADAESYLGEPVTDAVITVPAYYNDIQRQATKDAGRIAGLNVLRIINEPTSAALAYGLDNGHQQKVLVYDLGGGTFDVSVIEIGGGVIEVLATCGDNYLGGDDFDRRITEYLAAEFRRENNIDLTRDASAMQRVREAAEQAKKELSTAEMAYISLPYLTMGRSGPVHMDASLTRAKFNELTADLVERTAGPVRTALADAGVSLAQLGKVLLVGGSTRIPAVQEKVRQLTGIEPSRTINPDECVAQGAAVQADHLSGSNSIISGSNGGNGILLLDVTPLSLSIETVGGVATRLIERNTTVPTRYSQIFSTVRPYQTDVNINVLQGERPMAKDNKCIGQFKLKGIKRAPAGVPQIEVAFDIDANGIVTVSARDLDTGKEQSITITANQKMSDAEIERAIQDAQQYAAQDGIRREALEVLQKSNQLLGRANQALSAAGKDVDKSLKKQVKGDMDTLRRLVSKMKPDNISEPEIADLRAALARLERSAGQLPGML